jgi:hypothetical protein
VVPTSADASPIVVTGKVEFSEDEIAKLQKAGVIPADRQPTWDDMNTALWDHLEATWFKPASTDPPT